MFGFTVQTGKCVFGLCIATVLLVNVMYLNVDFKWRDKVLPIGLNVQKYYHKLFSSTVPAKRKNTTEVVFTEIDYVRKASEIVRNLPVVPFILGTEGHNLLRDCANFPTYYAIDYSNVLWQVQRFGNWTVHLFGAYWDIRKLNKDAPSIRILGMMDVKDEEVPPNFCQIWFQNQTKPLIVPVTNYSYAFQKYWGNYRNGELLTYIFNCPLPRNFTGTQIPLSVSFVPSPCANATNNLRVHFDMPKTKEKPMIAVCCKWLDFKTLDWSTRLIEWIEMLHILGVHKIYTYKVSAHPNMEKVLKYYEDLGKIEVSPLTLPAGLTNEPHLRRAYFDRFLYRQYQHDLIALNDCFYRNLYKYNFISLLDTDEIVIPHNGANNWIELINTLEKKNKNFSTPYYVFSSVGFTTEDRPSVEKDNANIPDYLYMLRHTVRWINKTANFGGIKAFHRPEEVLTLHNHFSSSCIGKCDWVDVNITDGFLHHYRRSGAEWTNLNESLATMDNYIWKWKDELIARTSKAIREIELDV